MSLSSEPSRRSAEALEQRDVEGCRTEVRDRGERGLGGLRRGGRLGRLARGGVGAGGELLRLVRQRTTARVELEQHGLTGLPGEPQLAASGVDPCPRGDRVPCATSRSRSPRRARRRRGAAARPPVPTRCPGAGVRPGREAPSPACGRVDDDVQAAEDRRRGAFEQRERVPRVGRQQRGRTPGECRRDGPLEPRLDLELTTEALALGRERARRPGRRLPLLERALERCEPVARGARALREVVALGRGRTGGGARLVRALLELGRGQRAAPGVRARRVLVREAGREAAALSRRATIRSRAAPSATSARFASPDPPELCERPVDGLALDPQRLEPGARRRPRPARSTAATSAWA